MTSGQRGAGRLVYVVDDELLIAQILEAILKLDGFEVKLFTDPIKAWESFRQEAAKPVLLVTDFAMGAMNGLELFERCASENPVLRCVMVSGNVNQGLFEDSPLRPDAFLEKPFLPQRLVATVHEVLAKEPSR